MEADMAGERIKIVNEYKVQTGQPLVGKESLPFGFMVGIDPDTKRKKVVKDPDEAPILLDLIDNYLTHQSKKKTVVYLHTKYQISLSYNTVGNLLSNPMLYGQYRDNPSYCDAYIDKATFDKLQEIQKRNVKENTSQNRAYIFSGLVICPVCGCKLKGAHFRQKYKSGVGILKKYRCGTHNKDHRCSFNKVVAEKTLERLMLANIERYLEEAKIRSAQVKDSDSVKIPKHNIEDILAQIDRLNYSWQTGKIRTVEKYEKDFADLTEMLEQAEAEQKETPVQDFTKIEVILHDGWRAIYSNLEDAYKRAFWRSFVQSIELDWTTEKKEIVKVNFF